MVLFNALRKTHLNGLPCVSLKHLSVKWCCLIGIPVLIRDDVLLGGLKHLSVKWCCLMDCQDKVFGVTNN